MYAVFFHEDHDAAGGALDYYGSIPNLDEETVVKFIYQFIIDRIRSLRYHADEKVTLNHCSTFNMTVFDPPSKTIRVAQVQWSNGGRFLRISQPDSFVGWHVDSFDPVLPKEVLIREPLITQGKP